MKRAYSYIRFSTAEQLKGKSLERQTEGATNWCRQHGVELDTELTLHDLGVSAFRGKNADVGALGSFLKAVHAGQVSQGSYLLIETFDRMSRESAYDAQLTLQNIINAGITVVTLMDGKQYSVSILRNDPLALIYAILLMSRSHEESSTKSKRVGDAWSRKRADLKSGKRLTAIGPGWITFDKDRKPKLIASRANIVRRIFTEFLSGQSRTAIVSDLNSSRVPTFRGGRWWSCTYVDMILSNRAVIGEFQPHRMDHKDRKRTRAPTGDPIKNYWPVVIDTRTFNKAQEKLKAARGKKATRLVGLKNILAGLGQCPRCGSRLERYMKDGARLVCFKARIGAGCSYRSAPLVDVEKALSANAATLAADVPDTTIEIKEEIAAIEAKRAALQVRILDMAMLLTDTPSKTVALRVQQDEAESERLQEELNRLTAQLQHGNARRVKESVMRMKSALQWHTQDPSDVLGVNAALRECFEKVVLDMDHRYLLMYWRHGQMTQIRY